MSERDRVGTSGLAWLYALTIAGYPLVSIVPVMGGFPSRLASVPYRAAMLLLALGVLLMAGVRQGRIRVDAAVWVPFTIFWLLYLLRFSLDTVFAPTSLRLSPVEYGLFILGITLVPTFAFFVTPTRAALRLALRRTTFVATLATAGVLALSFQTLLADGLTGLLATRLSTEALNPISLGHLGVSLMLLTLFVLLSPGPPRSPLLLLFALGLGGLTVVLSASRAALVVLAVTVPLLLVTAFRRGVQGRPILVAALGAATIVAGWIAARERADVAAIARLTTVLEDVSTRGRIELITDAWDQYIDQPVLGAGLAEARSGVYPHNVVVEAFMATGIVGGFAFITLLAMSLAAMWRVLVRRPEHGWVVLLCVQYLIAAQISGALWASPEMWSMLAAVFALSMALERPDMEGRPPQPEVEVSTG